MKIEAKIIIEDGVISFEAKDKFTLTEVSEHFFRKMGEEKEAGKKEVIENLLRNIEKLAKNN